MELDAGGVAQGVGLHRDVLVDLVLSGDGSGALARDGSRGLRCANLPAVGCVLRASRASGRMRSGLYSVPRGRDYREMCSGAGSCQLDVVRRRFRARSAAHGRLHHSQRRRFLHFRRPSHHRCGRQARIHLLCHHHRHCNTRRCRQRILAAHGSRLWARVTPVIVCASWGVRFCLMPCFYRPSRPLWVFLEDRACAVACAFAGRA
mmetsp:Transcript_39523/g.113742  ORF Transcript_39523/g.113742 Transcript_39523/m.113742 type:complete len:205 (+) Transcript_39523:1538-2152(+)